MSIQAITTGPAQLLTYPTSGDSTYSFLLNQNCTFSFYSFSPGGFAQKVVVEITQGGVGGFVPTFNGVNWAGGVTPTPNPNAGYTDIYEFFSLDGGVTIVGTKLNLSGGTISSNGGGSTTTTNITTTSNGPIYYLSSYTPTGYTLGTGSSQPLSSVFSSLTAAQAVFPNATSTSQELDAVAIQAAINAAYAAGGGVVMVPAGKYKINFQIRVPIDKVQLRGTHTNATFMYCSQTGTTPPFHLSAQAVTPNYGWAFGACVLSDMTICGNAAGPITLTPTSAGNPATGFTTGTSALLIDSFAEGSIERVKINGFDITTNWGSYAFCIEFAECSFDNNNKGIVWPSNSSILTSGENIRYRSCYAANNNYGVYVDGSTTAAGIYTFGVDMVIDSCSIDYNNVQQVWYKGSGGALVFNRLLITNTHIENNTAFMGNTNYPILVNYGKLTLQGCVLDWQDNTPPPAFINLATDEVVSEIVVTHCAFNGNPMPVVGPNVENYSVRFNTINNSSASGGISAKYTGSGVIYQQPQQAFFFAFYSRGIPGGWVEGTVVTQGSITLTLDTTLGLAIGSSILIRTSDSGTVTVTQNNGSISTPAGSNSFGGTPGKECRASVINGGWALCFY